MTNALISETLANLAEILPANQANGSVNSAPFQLNKSRKAMASILVGTGGGNVTAQFQWAATSAGPFVVVPGALTPAQTGAGIQQIEIRADRVAALGCGPYFQLVVTVAGGSMQTAAIVQGGDARFEPNSDNNDATVLAPAVVV